MTKATLIFFSIFLSRQTEDMYFYHFHFVFICKYIRTQKYISPVCQESVVLTINH